MESGSETKNCCPVFIRDMALTDVERVYRIETSSYPSPWPIKCFYDELTKNRFARYIVAVDPATGIVGYSGQWIIKGESHITNVAVSPDFRRRRIAEQLLISQIEYALRKRARAIYLEVRRYNIAAQRLYVRYRFVPTRVREGYYQDNNEDAIELRVHDTSDPRFLETFKRKRQYLLDTLGLKKFPGTPAQQQ